MGPVKRWVRARAEVLARALVSLGVGANAITVASLLLNCLAGLAVASGWLALGGLLYLLFSSLDFLDGAVARISGTAGPFGAFLDSTLDRLAEAVVLLGLVYWFAAAREPLWAAVTAGAMVTSFSVSYARARAEGLGYDCEVGWLQRPERIVLVGVALALSEIQVVVLQISLVVLLAATAVTTIQRIAHVAREVGDDPGRRRPAR